MFTSHKQLRTQSETTFFNDKTMPTGSMSERLTLPVLDCLCSPKGVVAYKYIFLMHKEKEFVTGTTCVQVTPAQKALLDLFHKQELPDLFKALKHVHECGTYFTDKDFVNLFASYQVSLIIEALSDLILETNSLKN